MTWTCDQIESQLSDYLEGLLQAPDRAAFEAHVADCPECTPLLASVRDLMTEMHSMAQVEEPPRLVYSILDKTLGPRETVSFGQGLRNLCFRRVQVFQFFDQQFAQCFQLHKVTPLGF